MTQEVRNLFVHCYSCCSCWYYTNYWMYSTRMWQYHQKDSIAIKIYLLKTFLRFWRVWRYSRAFNKTIKPIGWSGPGALRELECSLGSKILQYSITITASKSISVLVGWNGLMEFHWFYISWIEFRLFLYYLLLVQRVLRKPHLHLVFFYFSSGSSIETFSFFLSVFFYSWSST